MMTRLILLAILMISVAWTNGHDWVEDHERRIVALEQQWKDHACPTSPIQPYRVPGREPADPCRGMCGGQAWWNGTKCVCPEWDLGEER